MKKMFLRAGAFAGLAMTALALASCGSSEVEVKDLDGNTYKIAATEDSESVAKAMVLATQQTTSDDVEKIYAAAVNAKVDANVTAEIHGVTGTVKANAEASLAASYGKNVEYAAYTVDATTGDYSKSDIEAASKVLEENLGILANAKASASFSNFSVDLSDEAFSDMNDEDKKTVQENLNKLNGKKASADAKAFFNTDTFYFEVTDSIPEEIKALVEDGEIPTSYYAKEYEPFGSAACDISNALNTYQTKGLSEFMAEYGDSINESLGFDVSKATSLDEKFFESDEFAYLVDIVDALGVSISKVNNGNVTFDVTVTEDEVLEAVKSLGNAQVTAIATLVFSGKDELFSASATINVLNGRFVQFKVSTSALKQISTLVMYAVQSIISNAMGAISDSLRDDVKALASTGLPTLPFTVEGSLAVELNFKYNGDVKAYATPDSSKTYVDLSEEDEAPVDRITE